MPDIRKVVITGGSGLIGSAVSRQLLAQNVAVVSFDNFSTGDWNDPVDNLVREKVDMTDPALGELLSTHAPDFVIHCAAHPGGRSLSEPVLDVETNALGSMRLFDWCARAQVPVIYLSSSVIYGDQPEGPILETAALQPGTIYGACKVASEHFLKILEDGYQLPWTVLRLFATYGAGHKPSKFQGIVNIMLTQLMEGNRIVVKGSLDRSRDMVYVSDAANAIVQCVFTPKTRGHVLNIGTESPVTIRDLIRHLCTILGKSFDDLELIEEPGTVGDPFYNSADCSKARELLDFDPQYDILKGLKALVDHRLQAV